MSTIRRIRTTAVRPNVVSVKKTPPNPERNAFPNPVLGLDKIKNPTDKNLTGMTLQEYYTGKILSSLITVQDITKTDEELKLLTDFAKRVSAICVKP